MSNEAKRLIFALIFAFVNGYITSYLFGICTAIALACAAAYPIVMLAEYLFPVNNGRENA